MKETKPAATLEGTGALGPKGPWGPFIIGRPRGPGTPLGGTRALHGALSERGQTRSNPRRHPCPGPRGSGLIRSDLVDLVDPV